MNKQMFKVVCPIEKKDGTGTVWKGAGIGYRNKDASINLYLDFLPINGKLQIREFTEEELRERSDRRSSYQSRGGAGAGSLTSMASMATLPAASQEPIPF
jgi:hypothetical protein